MSDYGTRETLAERQARRNQEVAPVIPVGSEARCPTCNGDGDARVKAGELRGGGGPVGRRMDVPCPVCQGTGQERVIPATDLRAWIKANRPHPSHLDHYDIGQNALLNDLSARFGLDEYTTKAPSGGER